MCDNLYCKHLFNSLAFHQLNVRLCTTLCVGEIISNYQEKNAEELAQKILQTRERIKQDFKNGMLPKECVECIYKCKENSEHDKIQKLDFYYWYHCNCGCYYCSYRDETKGEFSDKIKKGNPLILETLAKLYENDVVSRDGDLTVAFGGGELGVLEEFDGMIDLFLKNNVNFVCCESSGVRYSKGVEKLLKNGKGCITVAVCSGRPELYKKIKNRDKYYQVMNNLRNYTKAAKQYWELDEHCHNVMNVISKFIILPGMNNKKEEIDLWLQESEKYGLKHVEVSMEFCWGIHTKKGQPVEDYNYELFDYAQKRALEMELILKKNPTSMAIMEKGIY